MKKHEMVDEGSMPPACHMDTIEISFSPLPQDLQHISDAVIAHDRACVGAGSPRPVACLAREDGRLIAGATGRIELRRLYVEFLWVDPTHRRRGLGSRLLGDIEKAAIDVGCTEAQIESLSDKTAWMYQRSGYQTRLRIADYIPGLALHILLKSLAVTPSPRTC